MNRKQKATKSKSVAKREAVQKQQQLNFNGEMDKLKSWPSDTRRLFEVQVKCGDVRTNARIYGYLYENKVVMGACQGVPDDAWVSVYFSDKEEAKMFRDVVNQEINYDKWHDESRKPDNYGHLAHVAYGPDHHRVLGEVK